MKEKVEDANPVTGGPAKCIKPPDLVKGFGQALKRVGYITGPFPTETPSGPPKHERGSTTSL